MRWNAGRWGQWLFLWGIAIGHGQDAWASDRAPLPNAIPIALEKPVKPKDWAGVPEWVPIDPELGQLQLWEEPLGDPELGQLRLQETPQFDPPDTSTVFLLTNLSVFNSDNILLDDFDPVGDQIFSGGITLLAAPSLGPDTYLFTSIGGNLAFYNDLSELNYSNFELAAGVRQILSPRTYLDASWTHEEFFSLVDGDRFLSDHSLRLAISHRQPLTSRLFLDGYYQLRFSFTDPGDRSRIFNQAGLTLGYDLSSDLNLGLNYLVVVTDFTRQDRQDIYHEITAQIRYDLSARSSVSLFAGFSFGDSTASYIDFDSSLIGVVFSTNISLF